MITEVDLCAADVVLRRHDVDALSENNNSQELVKKEIAIKHPPWQANLLGQVQDQMDPSNVNYGSICGKGIKEEGFKDRSPPEVANRRDQTVSIPSYALSNPRPSELLSSIFLVSSLKALSLFEFNPMS